MCKVFCFIVCCFLTQSKYLYAVSSIYINHLSLKICGSDVPEDFLIDSPDTDDHLFLLGSGTQQSPNPEVTWHLIRVSNSSWFIRKHLGLAQFSHRRSMSWDTSVLNQLKWFLTPCCILIFVADIIVPYIMGKIFGEDSPIIWLQAQKERGEGIH